MLGIGPMEMVIVGVIALLLFGKRLPEVARSLGKGITEFKKGVQGIEDDIDRGTSSSSSRTSSRAVGFGSLGKSISEFKKGINDDPGKNQPSEES